MGKSNHCNFAIGFLRGILPLGCDCLYCALSYVNSFALAKSFHFLLLFSATCERFFMMSIQTICLFSFVSMLP